MSGRPDEVRAGCGWSMCGGSACARTEVEMVKIRSTMKMQPKKINKIIHYSYVCVRLDEESKTCASLESPIGLTLKQCQVNTQKYTCVSNESHSHEWKPKIHPQHSQNLSMSTSRPHSISVYLA